ncbi:hypothetical protein AOC36_06900 [Erysipelothrix larvae]|uniref:Uncharacterized protein n=1 Tax=Erysipelothrix larvae TaxID=1514105 RepID=A0A0X8H0P1_9FIRM|nr:RCC1 domain-containing protein [Erysipelothrix larvae]AMC93719.1 hypothetical protein AOC36_06900 [Erysipelothrix larvae]
MEMYNSLEMYCSDYEALEIERLIKLGFLGETGRIEKIGFDASKYSIFLQNAGYEDLSYVFSDSYMYKLFPLAVFLLEVDDFYASPYISSYLYGFPAEKITDSQESMPKYIQNAIIGDFDQEFDEKDVKKKSFGAVHEVVLLKNGKLIGRGSNINGQIYYLDEFEDVVDISCGQFNTVVLQSDGSVVVTGRVGTNWRMPVSFNKLFVPSLSKNFLASYSDKSPYFYKVRIEMDKVGKRNKPAIFTENSENIGYFKTTFRGFNTHLMNIVDNYDYCINRPKRLKNKKWKEDYFALSSMSKVLPFLLDNNVTIIEHETWTDIKAIYTVDDGVLGVNSKGDLFFDGTAVNLHRVKEILKSINTNQLDVTGGL